MIRFASFLFVSLLLWAASTAVSPNVARAQTADVNAEAQVFFERGNRLFEQSARARGARRTQLLEEALQAYVSTLRIVRSRNALFNAAVVLERLERPNEAFAYLVEYLAIEGLNETERRDGQERLARLRPQVAVLRVTSEPAGAEVYVDRLDLAPRGRTPLEIAVPPGRHLVVARRPHHEDARAELEATVGETTESTLTLAAEPVTVELVLEADATDRSAAVVSLDGERTALGAHTLAPGPHVASLTFADGRRHDERFTLAPGDPTRRVVLRAPTRPTATLVVQSNRPATVRVDDEVVGQGEEVRVVVDAGRHRLSVEAAGLPARERDVELAPGAESRVNVQFAVATERRFGAAPAVLATATGVLAVTWGGLALRSLFVRQDYDDRCPDLIGRCPGLFDRVERLNLAADVMLGVAAATLVTTIVLFARRGGSSDPAAAQLELRVGPRFGGLGGRF